MSTEIASPQLHFAHGLWLGRLDSPFGVMELVLDGTPDAPHPAQEAALNAFLPTAADTIDRLRGKLSLAFLYQPIRVAINNKDRVDIQFRNRIPGSQARLMFADEA